MKKLHISFGILAGIMTVAALICAVIWYIKIDGAPYTGLPASAAFVFVGIYYAVGLAALGISWLVAWLILRRRACKKSDNAL